MLRSHLCRESDFHKTWFANACLRLRSPFRYHRKLWEFCFIYQALLERGMMVENKSGLGFGVGKEPLASLFASHGCRITATDLDEKRAKDLGWVDSNQHSSCLDDLKQYGICDPEKFAGLVVFESLDMNNIGAKYHGGYDFTWSSCAFEHLGSIRHGLQFVLNQMDCLRPGGVAVHTTEYNLSSNKKTADKGATVLFRRRDMEQLARTLRSRGHNITVDYSLGLGVIDKYTDTPPYREDCHLRLEIGCYVTTSIGLIITKKRTA